VLVIEKKSSLPGLLKGIAVLETPLSLILTKI
jgi:hypothetical protein